MRKTLIPILLFFCFQVYAQEQKVKVNGIDFNVYVKGMENRMENTPVMVFENGMGVDLNNWNKVIDQISEFAPVLAYDRTGIGKTEKVYELPTIQFVNQNLHALLQSLKISPP